MIKTKPVNRPTAVETGSRRGAPSPWALDSLGQTLHNESVIACTGTLLEVGALGAISTGLRGVIVPCLAIEK